MLTLYRRVPTFYLKQLAQTGLLEIDGIEAVNNRIEVMQRFTRNADALEGVG